MGNRKGNGIHMGQARICIEIIDAMDIVNTRYT